MISLFSVLKDAIYKMISFIFPPVLNSCIKNHLHDSFNITNFSVYAYSGGARGIDVKADFTVFNKLNRINNIKQVNFYSDDTTILFDWASEKVFSFTQHESKNFSIKTNGHTFKHPQVIHVFKIEIFDSFSRSYTKKFEPNEIIKL